MAYIKGWVGYFRFTRRGNPGDRCESLCSLGNTVDLPLGKVGCLQEKVCCQIADLKGSNCRENSAINQRNSLNRRLINRRSTALYILYCSSNYDVIVA